MKSVPFDLVADWQPEPETVLSSVGKNLAALVAVAAFTGLIGSVAILFA